MHELITSKGKNFFLIFSGLPIFSFHASSSYLTIEVLAKTIHVAGLH